MGSYFSNTSDTSNISNTSNSLPREEILGVKTRQYLQETKCKALLWAQNQSIDIILTDIKNEGLTTDGYAEGIGTYYIRTSEPVEMIEKLFKYPWLFKVSIDTDYTLAS